MKITTTDYLSILRRLVDSAAIFNLRPTENDHVFENIERAMAAGFSRINESLQFELAWAVSVRIAVSIRLNSEAPRRCEPRVVAKAKCELSWSATSRDIASALAAVALYGKALALAAQIEATFADVQIDGLNPADYREAE